MVIIITNTTDAVMNTTTIIIMRLGDNVLGVHTYANIAKE